MDLRDKFFEHSSIMVIASGLTMIFNYFYQIFMGRVLGPSNYGILGSVLSLMYIFSIPTGTLQTVIAKFTSKFKINNDFDKIGKLFQRFIKYFFFIGLISFIFVALLSSWIANFLKMPSVLPLIILASSLSFIFILPINFGILQGLQKFFNLALNTTLLSVFKLFFGVCLVYIGLSVNGAVGALVLSTLLVFFVSMLSIKPFFKTKGEININFIEIYKYSLPVFLFVTCLTMLTNIDVILVKHFLSAEEAGLYSATSVLGRAVFYASLAIATVIFPKISELYEQNMSYLSILRKGLIYVSFLSLSAFIGFKLFSPFIVKYFLGEPYLSIVPLLPLFTVAMSFLSLTTILAYYNLSINKTDFLYVLIVGTISEIILISLFHETLLQIIKILIIVNFLIFVVNSLNDLKYIRGSSDAV